MDPNEVSGGSDPDSEAEELAAADSDDDGARAGAVGYADDDDGEPQPEEDDDDDVEPPANPKPALSGRMDAYLTKKSVPAPSPARKPGKAAAPKGRTQPTPAPAAPRGVSNGAPKSKSKEAGRTFDANHSDDSDDQGLGSLTVPKNPGVTNSMQQVSKDRDVMQEYEDRMAKAPSSESAPRVHASAREPFYVMKNEKTNNWFHVDPSALVYAPELVVENLFRFSSADITHASKQSREAMQSKLVCEECVKVSSTAMVFKLAADGTGSATGPCVTSVMFIVPYWLTEVDAMRAMLATQREPEFPVFLEAGDKRPIIGLLALGVDAIKDAYAVRGCPLPAQYDPTKPTPGTKFKAPPKLDDLPGFDQNFTNIGALKKGPAQKRAGGDGPAKGDAKKPRTPAEAAHEAPNGTDGPASSAAPGPPGAKITTLTCAADQKLTLLPSAEEGRYFLITTPK